MSGVRGPGAGVGPHLELYLGSDWPSVSLTASHLSPGVGGMNQQGRSVLSAFLPRRAEA